VSYELSAALACVLAAPDAQARWLRGEAVFDAAAVDRSAGAAAEAQREAMLDTLLAIVRGEPPQALLAAPPA
jgi:hypothetical protein